LGASDMSRRTTPRSFPNFYAFTRLDC